jgi:hypothetical protein
MDSDLELAALRAECAARSLGDVATQLHAAAAAPVVDVAPDPTLDAGGAVARKRASGIWFTPAPAPSASARALGPAVPRGSPWTHRELAAARKLWKLELDQHHGGPHLQALCPVLLPGRSAEDVAALLRSNAFATYRDRLQHRRTRPGSPPPLSAPAVATPALDAGAGMRAGEANVDLTPDALAELAWGLRKVATAKSRLDALLLGPEAPPPRPHPAAATAATPPPPTDDVRLAVLDACAEVYRKRAALDVLLGAPPTRSPGRARR